MDIIKIKESFDLLWMTGQFSVKTTYKVKK